MIIAPFREEIFGVTYIVISGRGGCLYNINLTKPANIKGCHYEDLFGNQCKNRGVLASIIEEMVFKEIKKYEQYIMSAEITEYNNSNGHDKILQKENTLKKIKKAIERLNDAYEMGDYSRDEWMERRKRRESEIFNLKKEIYELKCESKKCEELSAEERLYLLKNFFDTYSDKICDEEKNSLLKTIINSILYVRDGNNIEININFL